MSDYLKMLLDETSYILFLKKFVEIKQEHSTM